MNNNYYDRENTIKLFDEIKEEMINCRNIIKKSFELDYKEWEYEVKLENLISIIENIQKKEYLPFFSKEKIIDGIGKIVLICNQNPYLIFSFILSCMYTNNKVEVVLERKLLATNKTIIEIIKKVLKRLKYESDTVNYIELDNKEDIVHYQNNYDSLYYFGNKESYIHFIKRINIDTKFEEFGEINIFADSKDFKNEIVEIDKWAYINEINVNIYNGKIEEAILDINRLNIINKITIIFSNNINNIGNFLKKVKSEKIYVNFNPVDFFNYDINLTNLVYKKEIKL